MNDAELFDMGPMANRSPAMFDRRRRMLAETRRMIGRAGYDGFGIRELARVSGVSSRTIYNAFGSKDRLVAMAIRSYFEDFRMRVPLAADPATLDGAIDRQIAITLRNLAIPHYLAAIASIYFSGAVPAEVRQVLVDIGGHQWSAWVHTLRVRRQLEPWVETDALLSDLGDLQFAEVHNWRVGRFAGDRLLPRTIGAVLTMLAGATRGAARDEVRALLRASAAGASGWTARCDAIARHVSVLGAEDHGGPVARGMSA